MTTSAELVNRVRTNINEPQTNQDPQRQDYEIAQWLEDGQIDYIQKIPADAVPELVKDSPVVGNEWTIPTDYLRLLQITVNHTVSGSITATEQAAILNSDEAYLTLNYPGGLGAWAQFKSTNSIIIGPNAFSGRVRYLALPSNISGCTGTFSLRQQHEEPIVNYATAQALAKINDEDAPRYLDRYDERVAAENGRYYKPFKVEKVPVDKNSPEAGL